MTWSQEDLRNSEAREWLRRYKKKLNDLGPYDARQWWKQTITAIAKIRGQDAADDLKSRMNRIKDEKSRQG